MRPIIFLFLFITGAAAGFSATIHVPLDYPTIQQAIGASLDGDTVLVQPGTYVECIIFEGKAIIVTSEQGPDATTIDGNQAGSVVTFNWGEGLDSLLVGFTVTNGSGNPVGGYSHGGGIFCELSSPTLSNNIISGNDAFGGGGIYCAGSYAAISNNIIRGNSSEWGGGIFAHHGDPVVTGNVIQGNAGGFGGGAEFCFDSSPTVCGNIIAGNSATDPKNGYGGGIAINDKCKGIFADNILYGNSATSGGGGIYCFDSKSVITNNTVYDNSASFGGGISCFMASPIITNTVVWKNMATMNPQIHNYLGSPVVTYCDVQGNWPGVGNIDVDPLLVDPANGDFHLAFPSPCRNAGDNTAAGLPAEDCEGDPRIAHGVVDMGADEFHRHLYHTGDAIPGGSVSLKFVDLPNTAPVGLFIGAGVLDPPLKTMWGDCYLKFPVIGPFMLGAIPSPDGVLVVTGTLPGAPPPPYAVPMQALIGSGLTNLCVLEVK